MRFVVVDVDGLTVLGDVGFQDCETSGSSSERTNYGVEDPAL